jgi:hypothetical protein
MKVFPRMSKNYRNLIESISKMFRFCNNFNSLRVKWLWYEICIRNPVLLVNFGVYYPGQNKGGER